MSTEWSPDLQPPRPGMVERAVELVSRYTTDAFLTINLDALSQRGWVAVPLLRDRFEDDEALRLAAAITQHLGSDRLMAVYEAFNWPGEGPTSAVWTVPPTEADLKDVAGELGPYYFLLTDEEPSFMIWCTKDDWHLLAGPSDFVVDVLGKPLDVARQAFVDFWNEDPGSHWYQVREPYLSWAERLARV
ncbi:MAG: hypothetical protein ACK46X_19845 [Candidatus Sericytochromatia bacterium]